MDIRYFELKAANKDCKDTFTDIEKKEIDGASIFELARNYVNTSSSYKRNGRSLEIIEIKDYSIIVKLSSENKLEMASKSLVGFTRELLRIDKEINSKEDQQYFKNFLYKNTLFKNTQLAAEDVDSTSNREMSDVDALKMCVDLFCNGMTLSKVEAIEADKIKKQIKSILKEHQRFNRLNSYTAKMEERKKV